MSAKTFLQTCIYCACLLLAQPVAGHVTLETTQFEAASYHKIVLRVPHGCQGEPTTALRVQIPEGMIAVKPQPKPGWTLRTETHEYAGSYRLHGKTVNSGVAQIIWDNGLLPDDRFDEFSFMVYLTETLAERETVYLPVLQACSEAVERWIESDRNASHPAPALKVVPQP